MSRQGFTGDVLVHRVNQLFETHRPAGRGPWSNAEIAARAAMHGYSISAAAIQQIRSGRRPNPTVRLLRGLAAAFDVPVTYFFESNDVDTSDQVVQEIRARSGGLSGRAAHLIADLVQELQNRSDDPDARENT